MKDRIDKLRIEIADVEKEVVGYILNYIDVSDGVELSYDAKIGWLSYCIPHVGTGYFSRHVNLSSMKTKQKCQVDAISLKEFEDRLKEQKRRKKTAGQIGMAFAYIINK